MLSVLVKTLHGRRLRRVVRRDGHTGRADYLPGGTDVPTLGSCGTCNRQIRVRKVVGEQHHVAGTRQGLQQPGRLIKQRTYLRLCGFRKVGDHRSVDRISLGALAQRLSSRLRSARDDLQG